MLKYEVKLGLHKVKLSLRLPKHQAIKPYEKMDVELHSFLI